MSKSPLLLVLFIVKVVLALTADDLLITLPDGQIRGEEYLTGNNKTYYGFHGIPFATPPVGELRFEAPIPPQPWSGVIDGGIERNGCMAASSALLSAPDSVIGFSEDCLYLNIYTPFLQSTEKLPVMFYIYGGGFTMGQTNKAMNGPDFFMEEDVIIVTHNYRVGAFGFLSTGDDVIRGNAGLKDQALAMKWTHDNIALFGGDPDKITIFGGSAGGQSAGLQTLSKLSIGLFRAAIISSGSILTNSSATLDPRSYAFLLASTFSDGDYGNDTKKLKEFLQAKTAEELNNAASSITGEDMHAWPTLEVEGEGAFLTESPYMLLENGNFSKVPIMLGICAEESLMFIQDLAAGQALALMLDTDRKKVIPSDLRPQLTDQEAVITKIRNLYLNENETFSTNLISLAEYISDNKFARALIKHAELHSNHASAYLYQFAYYGRAYVVPFIDGVEKASHGAELPFLFNISNSNLYYSSQADDLLTQNRVVKLWANFAKYLNPTPERTDLLNNVIWPTTSGTNLQYININNTLEIREGLKELRYRGWNETYYSYGKQPFVTFFSAPTADDLLITLSDGQIRGVEFVNGNNKTYYGFHGIPFATPPLGDLRFEAPQPPQPWSGILDGAKESKNCIAGSMLSAPPTVETSEDCLYINVYTPSLKPAEKLPVMFWIYGGAFVGGGALKSMNSPDFLIEEDVILVTHNYRVGAFGFLSTGDEAMRGNAGLKDQVLALKWTRDNIALFGGDPDKVTIFGQSAGGQSTGLQMMSKLSKGLFRAAIVQSGSVLTNSSATTDPRSYAFQVANFFSDGEYGNDTLKLKQFLQQKTTEEISNAAASITGLDIHAWPSLEVEGDDAFITESPYVLSESGNFNQVPVMIGICAEESVMFISDEAAALEMANILDYDRKKAIPSDLIVQPEDEEAAVTKIRNLYLDGNQTFASDLGALITFTSDNKFGRALIKHAELQSSHVPVYLYQFAYYGRSSYVPFIDGVEKAGHGAELAFIFNQTSSGPILSDEDDLLTQNRMVKLWTNFAKYLNPTPEESELFGNITWPTTDAVTLQYLNINSTLDVKQGLKQPRYQGWNETYYSYGKQPFITF